MVNRYVKQKNTSKNRGPLLITVLALILVLTGGTGLYLQSKKAPKQTATQIERSQPKKKNEINYDPPTAEDQNDVNQNKVKITESQQESSGNNKRSINAILTSAHSEGATVYIRGFVSGVIENGGLCSYTITNGGSSITKTNVGEADATTTRCALEFNRNELNTGKWSISMHYSSNSGEGKSNTVILEIN